MIILNKIKSAPSTPKGDVTHWADYVEVLCLIRQDRLFSLSDAIDWFKELSKDVPESEDELVEPENDDSGNDSAISNDRWETRVRDIYNLLAYRAVLYGTYYPFTITNSGNGLTKKSRFTERQKMYVFLLLCSSLRLIKRDNRTAFTSGFELLSKQATINSLPKKAVVHLFGGANSIASQQKSVNYKGSLFEKITKLAKDLNTRVLVDENEFLASSNQDGGLDIVAWLPTGDSLPNVITFFGQCACSPTEWRKKAESSSFDHWRGRLFFHCPPVNSVFIPHCMRNAQGLWHQGSGLYYMVFDRKRLLLMIDSEISKLETTLPMRAVNSMLSSNISAFD